MSVNFKISPNVWIGDSYPVYFIAEIGQNHQGNIEIAKKMILEAKNSGANCVKFQKSDLNAKFTKAALEKPYINANSWGKTYGEHKAYLEFSKREYVELQNYANLLEITFTASGMDIPSIDFLHDELHVPFLKIGSGDANNMPLIQHAAHKNIPLVISTGMQNINTIRDIYNAVIHVHRKFALMHCVSAYPMPLDAAHLRLIQTFQQIFPQVPIGYSGHEIGTDVSIAAAALGAKVIERHITLDKTLRGSDHKCALLPEEFQEMVTRIRNIEVALGPQDYTRKLEPCEFSCYEKLGKSVVMATNRKAGYILKENDLRIKVAYPKGLDGSEMKNLIGKSLLTDLTTDECVLFEHVS